jgi:hypothetical protein
MTRNKVSKFEQQSIMTAGVPQTSGLEVFEEEPAAVDDAKTLIEYAGLGWSVNEILTILRPLSFP